MHTNQEQDASPPEKLPEAGAPLSASNLVPISHSEIESRFAIERLRQAKCSFNLALVAVAFSAVVGSVGVLLMTTQPKAGAATAVSGAGATLLCLRLAKDANDRLDKAMRELDDTPSSSHYLPQQKEVKDSLTASKPAQPDSLEHKPSAPQ